MFCAFRDVCSFAGGDSHPQLAQFPADYVGDYFFADYCAGWIRRIDTTSGVVTGFATGISSPVDVRVDFSGSLYYLERGNGRVYKVTYTGSNAPTITQDPESQLVSDGFPVTFTVSAAGAPTLAYQCSATAWTFPGDIAVVHDRGGGSGR